MKSDDRQHPRAHAKLEAEITSELESFIRGTVQDVSLSGVFVVCRNRLPVGTLCEVAIDFEGADGSDRIEAAGRIAHVESDGMGIQLTELALVHYEELRRLVHGDDASGD
ncbi:MAG: PilZ domain-containing protein [Myxococcales bacterium]|nr:PilZ domain-containing protein [Myxococcales bacterium]